MMVLSGFLVLLSGAAALTYELIWFRQLSRIFGNTVQAATVVLAVWMIGLALGARWSAGWPAAQRNPLRVFGLLELGIAGWACVTPIVLAGLQGLYLLAVRALPESAPVIWLRLLLGLLALLPPTLLMGATLPVLASAIQPAQGFGRRFGGLYGLNTFGAVAGLLFCGFHAIPAWGLQRTLFTAVALSASVGAIALLAGRRRLSAESVPDIGAPLPAKAAHGLLVSAALWGFLALALEVVWFRALILVMGSTTYSFTVMTALFLAGIALGAWILGPLADRLRHPSALVVTAWIALGAWIWVTLRVFPAAPEWLLQVLEGTGFTWAGALLAQALLAVVFLLPPALCSGGAFTAIVRALRAQGLGPSQAAAQATLANGCGAAAGALLAGLVLLPAAGLQATLAALGVAAVLAATILAWPLAIPRGIRLGATLAALVLVVAFARFTPAWDPTVLASGAYFAPWSHIHEGRTTLHEQLRHERLLFYREGRTATVSVTQGPDGRLFFCSDGKVEADTSPRSMVLQRMIAHLPMLCHPSPQRVLNIGMGAGVTLGALGSHGPAALEVAEIEPAVTNVVARWAAWNHGIGTSGVARLRINDGRNHLLVTTGRYDVITSDPFEPVVAGAANLYTVEHFRLARERLNAGGLMAQFLPLYELSPDDVAMIMRSFATAFPHTAVFFTGYDTILLGFTDGAGIDTAVIAGRFARPAVRASLAEIGVTRPAQLLEMLVSELHPGGDALPPGLLNTDDRPLVEFSAPRSVLDYQADRNQRVLLEAYTHAPDLARYNVDPAELAIVAAGREALRLVLMASLARHAGDTGRSVQLLAEALRQSPGSPIIRNELTDALGAVADAYRAGGDVTNAVACYETALAVDADGYWPRFHLMRLALLQGDATQADAHLQRALQAHPDAPLLIAFRGQLAGARGDLAGAARDLGAALQVLPRDPELWAQLAYALEQLGQPEPAATARARAAALRR